MSNTSERQPDLYLKQKEVILAIQEKIISIARTQSTSSFSQLKDCCESLKAVSEANLLIAQINKYIPD